MMASVDSWSKLFKEGQYSACSSALGERLEGLTLKDGSSDSDTNRHAQVLTLENNIFVCNQLNQHWDSKTEENVAQNWSQGYSDVLDLYRRMRCQHVCSRLPLDLILSVTSNVMWWGIMKADPSGQQPCQREVINAAIYSLNTVRKLLGGRNPDRRSYETLETNFIDAVNDVISCLPKLTSRHVTLSLEIISLGILSWADNCKTLQDKGTDFERMIDSLVDVLPQVKVHLSYENKTGSSNLENILKFGWKETAEILSESSFSTISEILLSIVAVFYCRFNSHMLMEKNPKTLKYLNLIDKNNLILPFIYHYLQALANYTIGNLDTSLYHLQRSLLSDPNFFMQARSKTLKGQILLSQEKASEALEILQSIQYKRKEVQLPVCAFQISIAYQKLGKFKYQVDVLSLLLDCLTAEQAVQPKLLSPLAGIQHRLLLSVHSQPEISAEHVIQTIALAHLSAEQPKEAAEKFLELLHMKRLVMDGADDTSMLKLTELFHDTTCALLEAHSINDAEKVCEAALQFHSSRLDSVGTSRCDFSGLSEDVIALMLLSEVKSFQKSSNVSEILNRCAKLLQRFIENLKKSKEAQKETLSMAKAFLGRVFLSKALLNATRKFDDDAVACFQRALTWNEGDPEIALHFARFLLDRNQHEESLALWGMYKDANQSFKKPEGITLNHLLGDKMDSDDREETVCRLRSLANV